MQTGTQDQARLCHVSDSCELCGPTHVARLEFPRETGLILHVQQPLHVVGVGLHVLHPGGHTPFLVAEEKQPLRYLLRTCYLPGPGERVVGHTEAAFAHTGDDSK